MARPEQPAAGKQYGLAQGAGGTDENAARLGVNQGAKARIGEGYVTQSISNPVGEREKADFSKGGAERPMIWGYHFSAVVAQSHDGADQIALENYNRSAEIEKGTRRLLDQLTARFAAELNGVKLEGNEKDRIGRILHWLETRVQATQKEAYWAHNAMMGEQIQALGRMWYFRMLGSHKGQSFHEQMAAAGAFINPLTVVVTGSLNPLGLSYDDEETNLDTTKQGQLRDFAGQAAVDLHRGRLSGIRVIGSATDSYFDYRNKALAQQRADTAKRFLADAGVRANLLQVELNLAPAAKGEPPRRKVELIPVR